MSKSSRDSQIRKEFKNVRRRYWRDAVNVYGHFLADTDRNIRLMKKGSPPRRWAVVRSKRDGHLFELELAMELHHVTGIIPTRGQGEHTLIEVWPHQHAATDEDRKINWEFVRWGRLEDDRNCS